MSEQSEHEQSRRDLLGMSSRFFAAEGEHVRKGHKPISGDNPILELMLSRLMYGSHAYRVPLEEE